jgi:hypothetical protein
MPHLPLLLALTVAHADLPPGATVDPAVAVDFTAEGLGAIEPIAQSLVPTDLGPPLDLFEQSDNIIDEDYGWLGWLRVSYYLFVGNFDLGVQVASLDLIPTNGRLTLDVVVQLSVSSAQDPGQIIASTTVAGDSDLLDWLGIDFSFDTDVINERCDVWLDPTNVRVGTTVDMALDPSTGLVDVEIGALTVDLDLDGFRIDGCILGGLDDLVGTLDSVLGFFGLDLMDLLLSALQPVIDDALGSVLDDLEVTLEEVFSSLRLSTEIPLGDAVLALDVAPSTLEITPAGLRLALAGAVDPGPLPDPCISRYVTGGSRQTGLGPPALGEGSATYNHHLGLFVDDDFLNQVLYGAWYRGVLCFELADGADSGIDLPIPIDTSLLGLLAPGEYDDLFPETKPLVMATRPAAPPEAFMDGDNDVDIEIDDLGLDLYAELDGRLTRVAGFDISALAGVDLVFDGTSGDLAIDLAFDPATDLYIDVGYNELKPASSEALESGIGGIVNTVVGPLLDGLTEGLAFALPSFEGIGLSGLTIGGAGPGQDFLGVYANLGVVPYNNALDASGGCDGGCDAGCASGGRPGPALAWLLPLTLLILRRREP